MNKAKTVYFLLIPDPCNLNYIVASTEHVWSRTKSVYSLVKECFAFTEFCLSREVRTMPFKLKYLHQNVWNTSLCVKHSSLRAVDVGGWHSGAMTALNPVVSTA